tara:strand:+ start:53306 stop:54535 length:1230 start_codon:yes stop_codon:yes gene_type:complete
MNKTLNKINENIEKLTSSLDLITIDKHKKNTINLINKLFYDVIESNELKEYFSTILNSFVLKKISERIENLTKILPSIIHRENFIEERVIISLNDLKGQLIRSYSAILKDSSEFNNYKSELTNKNVLKRDFLLNPYYSYNSDEFIEDIAPRNFEKLIDKGLDDTIQFFKNSFEGDYDKERSRQQLTRYIVEIDNKINILSKLIFLNNEKLKKLKNNISNDECEDNTLDNKTEININMFDNDLNQIMFLNKTILNDEYLNSILIKFKKYAFKAYPFLNNTINNNGLNYKNVFGKFNNQLLIDLYEEFKFFLEINTNVDEFVEVFTKTENRIGKKINLTNGILDDYGSIITKLYPYFSKPDFNVKKDYDSWWAENFTFNGVEKDVKSIGKIKNPHSYKHISQIQQIIAVLE